jgi:hypothetical protein
VPCPVNLNAFCSRFPGPKEACRGRHLPRWHSGGDSYVGKGSINERTQSDQGTLQHRPGCPAHPDIARFDGSEGEGAAMNEVPQLVREKSQPFIQRLNAIVRYGRIVPKFFSKTASSALREPPHACCYCVVRLWAPQPLNQPN